VIGNLIMTPQEYRDRMFCPGSYIVGAGLAPPS
jgi:hypothetical protein